VQRLQHLARARRSEEAELVASQLPWHKLSSQELAVTAWSVARLRLHVAELKGAIQHTGCGHLDAKDMAKMAWDFATLRYRDLPA